MSIRVAALVLAAGAAERMGRVKALLALGDSSLLARSIALVRAGGCSPVIVVEGAHPLDAEPALRERDVVRACNPDWPLGPLGSLQAGLRAALERAPELDGVLVQHVERPRVEPATVAALIAGLAAEPDAIWQPEFEGRSGHPMLWPRACFGDLLALDPARASARTLARAPEQAWRRRKLAVGDPGVLDNIDTPDDYRRLCETLGVVPSSGA
ncbi:nucleotidyltransferase family protein [Nannocystaceae bacterium ST9]